MSTQENESEKSISGMNRKVSGFAARIASQPVDTKTFDSADQVINKGMQDMLNVAGQDVAGFVDQAAGMAAPVMGAAGAGFSALKLFKGVLEDDLEL